MRPPVTVWRSRHGVATTRSPCSYINKSFKKRNDIGTRRCGPFVSHLAANLRVRCSTARLPFEFRFFPEYKTFLPALPTIIASVGVGTTLFGIEFQFIQIKQLFLFCLVFLFFFFVFCFVLKLAGFSSLRSFDCSPLASTVKFGTPFPISFPYSFPIHFPFVFLFVCPFQSGPPSGKWITSTAPSDFRLISHHFSFRLFNYYPK